jgi:hypothetical protein
VALINILCCPFLDVKEIGANHFQINVRSASLTLTASIGAESESLQVVAHREKLPPAAMMEVFASESEAAIKATNYLRRSVLDS